MYSRTYIESGKSIPKLYVTAKQLSEYEEIRNSPDLPDIKRNYSFAGRRAAMKRKIFPLIRDLVVSFTIGCLSTYLPFWRMDGKYDQGMIGFAVGVLVLYFMVATNRDYQ